MADNPIIAGLDAYADAAEAAGEHDEARHVRDGIAEIARLREEIERLYDMIRRIDMMMNVGVPMVATAMLAELAASVPPKDAAKRGGGKPL